MRIDSHQHFWNYNPQEYDWIDGNMQILRRDFTPADLAVNLKENGFDGSIAVQARQSLQETRYLLSLSDDNVFIKGVVGWVDICSEELEEQLEFFCRHPKFVGVRHVVQAESDERFMLRPDFIKGLKKVEKYGLTYDILIFPKHLPVALELVRQFPYMTFVLDHIAKPLIKDSLLDPWREEISTLGQFPNVYCKISGMVTEADCVNWVNEDFYAYLDVVYKAFGSKRLLVGSDWPVCTLGGDYGKVMGIAEHYFRFLPSSEKDAIWGGNALDAYPRLKILHDIISE